MSRLRSRSCLLLTIAIAGSAIGCVPDRLDTVERRSRGLVVVLPGIEGPSIWNRDLALGLDDGGVHCAIRRHEWGTPIPGGFLLNLTDIRRNGREAERLRDELVIYMTEYPGRPVQLVGHSGGAGIALLTAERMPKDLPLTSITLLAASVSPEFNLRPALSRTKHTILNCYSQRDDILLGPGTQLAGTIDRAHTESAGKVGFTFESALLPVERHAYGRLNQVAWTPAMRDLGNNGGHFGWTNRRFVREWLAPKLRRHLTQPADRH